MRSLIFSFFLLTSFGSQAYNCPPHLPRQPKAMQALAYMQKFKGLFQLGSCHVEIITCDPETPQSAVDQAPGDGTKIAEVTSDTSPVAEILVVDGSGREVYATLVFPETNNEFLKSDVQVGKRVLHFEKRDRFYEAEFGRTEYLRMELSTQWSDYDTLKSIEIGTYATHKALNQPNGNDSRWYICKE